MSGVQGLLCAGFPTPAELRLRAKLSVGGPLENSDDKYWGGNHMSDVISATIGSVAGAFLESIHGCHRDQSRNLRDRRRASAESLLLDLRPLHRRMRKVDFSRNPKKWSHDINRALHCIEANQSLLPDEWRHLCRSVRAAVGEATGLGWSEVLGGKPSKVASFDAIWIEHGAAYVGYTIAKIERWQNANRDASARRIRLADFDTWLRLTGKYSRV
ncbi:hypothetical protein [Mycetocola sp. 2940]|uniref:hypothetical protein n=1 Tax=Mycetocola sp. 2940 TaxID=3156452 RepID=UPI00339AF74A